MNIRFMISAVYSVVALCGGIAELPDKLPENTNVTGPVYQAEKNAENTESTLNKITEIYLPGFDINGDGVFDTRDSEQITETRKQKKLEAEEEAKRKAEEEKKAAEEAAKLAAEQAKVTEAVTETPVTETEAETQPVQNDETEEPEVTEETSMPELPAPKQRRGVDISSWQGEVDFEKLKNDGVEFVIIKAGEGMRVSESFYTYIKGAKEAGLPCGAYWFSKASTYSEAVDEAKKCLEVVSDYKLEFPVVCDYEYAALTKSNPFTYDKTALTDAILAFLDTVEQGGYYSMYYTNLDFSSRLIEFDRIKEKYDVWCADYGSDYPRLSCGMWQHAQYGRKNGIDIYHQNSGYVDLDIAYKDYPEIMKALHINGF